MRNIYWIFCLVALIAMPASAQLTGVFKDGPHLAYPHGGDVRKERMGFGWQVAYENNDYLSLEASVSRYKDKLDDLELLPEPLNSELDQEIVNISLSGRLGYPVGRFYPYLGGGLGYYFMRTDGGRVNQSIRENPGVRPLGVTDLQIGADLDNTFGYQLAVGIEWLITSKWEIFAEYRRVFLNSDITIRRTETRPATDGTLALDRSQTEETEDFDYDHGLLRVGVNYRF